MTGLTTEFNHNVAESHAEPVNEAGMEHGEEHESGHGGHVVHELHKGIDRLVEGAEHGAEHALEHAVNMSTLKAAGGAVAAESGHLLLSSTAAEAKATRIISHQGAELAEGISHAAGKVHGGLAVKIGMGVAAGVATYAVSDSLLETGKVTAAAMMPYGGIAADLATGDTKLAVKDTMVESAGWAGAAYGATQGATIGAALGSAVPVIGTAVGAVAGGIVGGVAGGLGASMGTDVLLEKVPEVVDYTHDAIKTTMDAVGLDGDTIKSAYNSTVATLDNGWNSVSSMFNSKAGVPDVQVAEAKIEAQEPDKPESKDFTGKDAAIAGDPLIIHAASSAGIVQIDQQPQLQPNIPEQPAGPTVAATPPTMQLG